MAGGPKAARGRRAIWIVAGAVALGVAAIVGVAVFRQPLAEWLLLAQLRGAGLTDVEATIGRFDRERLEVRDLRVGDDLVLPSLEARYSPTGLFSSRLDSLHVSGLRLRGAIDASGVSFGRLDAALAGGDSGAVSAPSAPAALPTGRFEIDDAKIEMTTPEGPLLGSLRAQATATGPGRLDASAEFTAVHRLATVDARLTAAGTPSELSGEVDLTAQVTGDFGSLLHVEGLYLAAKSAFDYDRGAIAIRPVDCATLHVENLEMPDTLALSRPLDLCIRAGAGNALQLGRDGDISIDVEVATAPFALTAGGFSLTGRSPELSLRSDPTRADALTVSTTGGEVRAPDFDVAARGIGLEVAVSRETSFPSGKLRLEAIADTAETKRFASLGASGSFEPVDDAIDFALELSDADRKLVIELSGRHDTAKASGTADLHLLPFRFCPDGPKLTDAIPLLEGLVSDAQGTLESIGGFSWDDNGVRGQVDVALLDVSATMPASVVEHVNAAIRLRPTGTPPNQLLSIGRVDFGLELTNGEVLFQVTPEGTIAIESASFEFAGGALTTAGTIDPFADHQDLIFEVADVDLETLFGMVDLEGLSGTGTLEGRLPLYRDRDEIEIRSAELHSTGEGGIIRYLAEGGAANVGALESQFGMLLSVLENFHYEKLSLKISGQALGTVVVSIHLEGSNPDYESGRPVRFNLSVESRLSDLVSAEGFVYQIPYLVEERLVGFTGTSVNTAPRPCVHD